MHNFVTMFGKILEICKKFAGNHVNEKGNVPRCGVVPTFSDLEIMALSIKPKKVQYSALQGNLVMKKAYKYIKVA